VTSASRRMPAAARFRPHAMGKLPSLGAQCLQFVRQR
jgi:hypothetical protein